jgi:hypothetical protein
MIIHNATLTGSISMQAPPVISGSLTLTGSLNATGDITASSARFSNIITAQTLVVQTVSSSVVYSSGSNVFGNLASNTHQFTGSMLVSGSATFSGSVQNIGGSGFVTSIDGGFRLRNDANSSNLGGLVRRSYWAGGAALDTQIFAETGYGIYLNVNGSSTTGMFISSSGNVGIATSSPLAKLHVGNGTQSGINGAENKIHIASNTSGGRSALLTLANSSGAVTVEGQFESSAESADLRVIIGSTSNHDVILRTNNVERMRITSGSGTIYMGGTNAAPWNITSGTVSQVTLNDTSYPLVIAKTSNVLAIFNQIGTAGTILEFKYQSNVKGSISTDGTNVAFNTSSDYRLKNDLKDFNGLNLINAIKTYNYEWKTNNTRAYGVLAHELAEIIPYAVHGDKDQLDDKGDILPQGVDYSKLVPILIKSIQELKAEFDEYKSTHP